MCTTSRARSVTRSTRSWSCEPSKPGPEPADLDGQRPAQHGEVGGVRSGGAAARVTSPACGTASASPVDRRPVLVAVEVVDLGVRRRSSRPPARAPPARARRRGRAGRRTRRRAGQCVAGGGDDAAVGLALVHQDPRVPRCGELRQPLAHVGVGRAVVDQHPLPVRERLGQDRRRGVREDVQWRVVDRRDDGEPRRCGVGTRGPPSIGRPSSSPHGLRLCGPRLPSTPLGDAGAVPALKYSSPVPITDLARAGAKRTQGWLRNDRRLERILRRGRLSGAQTLYSHELVLPMNSTYAPWHDDRAFRRVYDAISGSTLVDQYKCYELWEQLGQLAHVPGDILEVGVWRGGTGVIMARRVKGSASRPGSSWRTPSPVWPRPARVTRGIAVGSTPTPHRDLVKELARRSRSTWSCSSACSPTTPATWSRTCACGWCTSTSTSTSRLARPWPGPGRGSAWAVWWS